MRCSHQQQARVVSSEFQSMRQKLYPPRLDSVRCIGWEWLLDRRLGHSEVGSFGREGRVCCSRGHQVLGSRVLRAFQHSSHLLIDEFGTTCKVFKNKAIVGMIWLRHAPAPASRFEDILCAHTGPILPKHCCS